MEQDRIDAATKAMASKIRNISQGQDVTEQECQVLKALQEGRPDLVKLTDLMQLAKRLNVPVSSLAA